jgi:hypothetical protein
MGWGKPDEQLVDNTKKVSRSFSPVTLIVAEGIESHDRFHT